MNYKTTELTFTIPLNGGDNYRMNECVDQEIVASWRRERNSQVEVNGGSK